MVFVDFTTMFVLGMVARSGEMRMGADDLMFRTRIPAYLFGRFPACTTLTGTPQRAHSPYSASRHHCSLSPSTAPPPLFEPNRNGCRSIRHRHC